MKQHFMIFLTVLVLSSLTACSFQYPRSVAPSSSTGQHEVTPTPHPSTNQPLIQTVVNPWQPGEWQSGVQVYWHTNHDSAFGIAQKASRVFDYIVGLGANSVGINFPIYTDSLKPTKVYAGAATPLPAELQIVLEQARLHKLRITVRPILDEANLMTTAGGWRGNIAPRDPDGWFTSYEQFLAPYLQIAATASVTEFVLGTELDSLVQDQARWSAMHTFAQQYFAGVVSFSINWTDYQLRRYGPYPETGIDAYPRFVLDDSATLAQVTAAWQQWLSATKPGNHTMTLQEVGIPAQAGMYRNPSNWGQGSAAINESIQANWFDAACAAAKQVSLGGIYFWMIDSNVNPALADPAHDSASSFIGRAGETAIRRCFA